MWNPPKYLVVETSMLPEVFSRVVYANHLLESGEVDNVSKAARDAGVSRSAMYKYRNSVFPYIKEMSGRVVSLYLLLRDKPGTLSNIITVLYNNGANILTINQNIPVDGVAVVSISIALEATSTNDMELLDTLKHADGVVEVRRLAAN